RQIVFETQFLQCFLDGTRAPCPDVLQAPADSLHDLHPLDQLQELLVRGCILNDELRLAVDRQHHRRAGLLELLHELGSLPLEISEGMDVPRKIDHWLLFSHRNRALSYATTRLPAAASPPP